MHEVFLQSEDCGFALSLPQILLDQILQQCIQSETQETGGILIGFYTPNHDCAVITQISFAPIDSNSGNNWFRRGVRGLQPWLNLLWRKDRQYYLGEWHFHPESPPKPSSDDIAQMQKIAQSKSHHCPEPLLLIIGGDIKRSWRLAAFVILQDQSLIALADRTRIDFYKKAN